MKKIYEFKFNFDDGTNCSVCAHNKTEAIEKMSNTYPMWYIESHCRIKNEGIVR